MRLAKATGDATPRASAPLDSSARIDDADSVRYDDVGRSSGLALALKALKTAPRLRP